MLLNSEEASVEDNLDVVALTDSSWRVCDKRFAPDDAQGLLAYMEEVDDHVAITLLKPPPVTFANASGFSEALALISERTHVVEYP